MTMHPERDTNTGETQKLFEKISQKSLELSQVYNKTNQLPRQG